MRFPEPAPADDLGAPAEERIARQAMAHGWAAVRASAPAPSYTNEEESTDASPELATPPTSPFRASGKESQEARSAGPFSASAEGYPDMGVPERAEERPTNALGMREDGGGNVRERFHAAARGILLGCGCPLCEGALAALGETGTADENAQRTQTPRAGGIADAARESALARALASGLSASVARMERVDESVRGLGSILQAALNQLEGTAGALRRRVEALEGQPLPGGPAAFALDKTLALTPSGGARSQPGAAEQRRALESLAGKLADPQAQIAVAAELIRLQRRE